MPPPPPPDAALAGELVKPPPPAPPMADMVPVLDDTEVFEARIMIPPAPPPTELEVAVAVWPAVPFAVMLPETVILPAAKIRIVPPPLPVDIVFPTRLGVVPLPPPALVTWKSCLAGKALIAVPPSPTAVDMLLVGAVTAQSPMLMTSLFVFWYGLELTTIVPTIDTVPVARIINPLGTVKVTPEATVKLTNCNRAVAGGLVFQSVVDEIVKLPSDPSP